MAVFLVADTTNVKVINFYRSFLSYLLYYTSRRSKRKYHRSISYSTIGETEKRKAREDKELSTLKRTMVETACKVNNIIGKMQLEPTL